MLRPEFPLTRSDEAEILGLVKDVADAFDSIAAGPMHTPALYSVLLRALLNSRTDPQGAEHATGPSNPHTNGASHQTNEQYEPSAQPADADGAYPPLDYQFASEMGPVADISTFPPTMANPRDDDGLGMLSMDTILNGGFWDNVLVPGEQYVCIPAPQSD